MNITASEFIVMTSSAKVAGKARQFGRYRHVAVLEIEPGTQPTMISERARGVRRIVWHSGAVSVGKSDKCAYARAQREAQDVLAKLQAGGLRKMRGTIRTILAIAFLIGYTWGVNHLLNVYL